MGPCVANHRPWTDRFADWLVVALVEVLRDMNCSELSTHSRSTTCLLLLAVLCVVVFTVCFALQAGDYGRWDETTIIEPVARGDLRAPHPPLYLLLLRPWLQMWSKHDLGARILNLCLFALTSAILLRIISRFREGLAGPFLVLILLFSAPLIRQGVMLIDYPATCMLSVTCYLWAILAYDPAKRSTLMWTMASILMVCLTSMSLVPIVLLSAPVYAWLASKRRTAVLQMLGIEAAAVFLFAALWYLFGIVYGNPLSEPFTHAAYLTGIQHVVDFDRLQRIFAWVGAPFAAMVILSTVLAIAKPCSWRLRFVGVIGWVLFVQSAALGILHYGFPKYEVLAFPFLIVFVAGCLTQHLQTALTRPTRMGLALQLLALALLCALAGRLGDPLLGLGENTWWLPEGLPAQTTLRLLLPSAMAVAAFFLIGRLSRLSRTDNMALSLLLGCLACWLPVQVIQARADYETRFTYGSTGFAAVLASIATRLQPTDLVGCPGDMGYYLRRARWFDAGQGYAQYSPRQLEWLVDHASCVAIPKELSSSRPFALAKAAYGVPVRIGDWSVFYSGSHNAANEPYPARHLPGGAPDLASRASDWREARSLRDDATKSMRLVGIVHD